MAGDRGDKPNQWLNACAWTFRSQYGEDGIIEKALEVIGDVTGWCVEFGAWDGIAHSNTSHLIMNKNYSAVLIEGDPERFRALQENCASTPGVTLLQAYVGWEPENNLDTLLERTNIPTDFDVLSIDIDGCDYHVWEAMRRYRPKVVVIEFNPTIPNAVEFVQPRDMRVNQGNSILSLTKLARQKGYELVAATRINAIFVDERYFARFGISDNSVDAIRTDTSALTYIFAGYDGTVFLSGCKSLLWHALPYNEGRIQQVPRFLRGYPMAFGRTRKYLLDLFRKFRRRNLL